MKKASTLLIAVFVISLFTFSSVSAGSTSEYEQYRPQCLNMIKNSTPDVEKLNSLLKTIKNKNDLISKKSDIIELVKRILDTNKGFLKIARTLDNAKRFGFIVWFMNLDPKYAKLTKTMRIEQQRLKRLPGCRQVMRQIDRELKKYRRNVR